jgi:hypothetical protein
MNRGGTKALLFEALDKQFEREEQELDRFGGDAAPESKPHLPLEKRLEYYKNYFINVSPSTFDIDIENDAIVITGFDKPYPLDFNDVVDTVQVPVVDEGMKKSKLKEIIRQSLEEEKKNIHEPVKPGILKKRLGDLSCTKVRQYRQGLKDKGTHHAKAAQRYLNYHCKD